MPAQPRATLIQAFILLVFAGLLSPIAAHAQSIVAMPNLSNNGCAVEQTTNTSSFMLPNQAVTAGDTIVILVTLGTQDAHVTAITDNLGDTYTVIPTAHGSDATAGAIDIAYAQNIAASSSGAWGTITTTSDNWFVGARALEITGVPATGQIVDCAASQDVTNPNTTTFITPPCTTSEPNELLIALAEGLYEGSTTTPECSGGGGGLALHHPRPQRRPREVSFGDFLAARGGGLEFDASLSDRASGGSFRENARASFSDAVWHPGAGKWFASAERPSPRKTGWEAARLRRVALASPPQRPATERAGLTVPISPGGRLPSLQRHEAVD